jgi:hypothetical protein
VSTQYPVQSSISATRSVSRRQFLWAGGGAATALMSAVSLEWTRHPGGAGAWIEHIVRKHLPGIALDPTSLQRFVREVLDSTTLDTKHQLFYSTFKTATEWLAFLVPVLGAASEHIERKVLTRYLVGSNFFRIPDPRRETIIYLGDLPACGNPFASLGPAEPLIK